MLSRNAILSFLGGFPWFRSLWIRLTIFLQFTNLLYWINLLILWYSYFKWRIVKFPLMFSRTLPPLCFFLRFYGFSKHRDALYAVTIVVINVHPSISDGTTTTKDIGWSLLGTDTVKMAVTLHLWHLLLLDHFSSHARFFVITWLVFAVQNRCNKFSHVQITAMNTIYLMLLSVILKV